MAAEDEQGSRTGDSARRFNADLAQARRASGLSLRQAAARTNWGKTTIASAEQSSLLANRRLVESLLRAAGIEDQSLDDWLHRYDVLACAERPDDEEVTEPAPGAGPQVGRSPSIGENANHLYRTRVLIITAIGIIAIGVVAAFNSWDTEDTTATVVVQNKIAYGATSFEEDDSPSYLSARPIARCANRGCKLVNTEMYSGATIEVTCRLQGDLITNANTESAGIKSNPNIAASALWYEALWPDGRRGYISEVYLASQFRGGLDLPAC